MKWTKEISEQGIAELKSCMLDLAHSKAPVEDLRAARAALKAARTYAGRGHHRAAYLRARAGTKKCVEILGWD